MNIFEALSYGKGRINEENTSSFLAYLLKGDESHGLRYEFLERFLKKTYNKDIDVSDYTVSVELEKGFNKKRYIDILLNLDNENEKIRIGIENKISSQSCQEMQLSDEYDNMRNKYEDGEKIIMIFIVPSENDANVDTEWNNLKVKEQDEKCKATWNNIVDIIKDMLKDEADCLISPLSDYVRQTLQAFCYYILNNVNAKKVKVTYKNNGKVYYLSQLSDKKMKIELENGEIIKGLIPKHMIFDVLLELDKNQTSYTTKWNGKDIKSISGTPQVLGAKMFEILNKKKKKEITITAVSPNFSEDNKRTGSNEF